MYKTLILFIALTLTACGGEVTCDDFVNGMCIVYNGHDVDNEIAADAGSITQELWSNRFGEVDLFDLAEEHGLVVSYEDDDTFAMSGMYVAYFEWNFEHTMTPYIHVAYRSRYSDSVKCMLRHTIGHGLIHFFVMTVGDNDNGHSDRTLWVNAAGKYGYKETLEYEIRSAAADICGVVNN